MKTRRLGNSDLHITPVGFGAWALGGAGWEFAWGAQDDKDSIAAIHRALGLGVNWIDTAAAYGLGHSEEVVARALASWPGPRPYVFTKCGLRGDEQGNVHKVLKADSMRRECEDSLRRLRAEAIDLYQIHWPTDDPAENDEGWVAMAELQREARCAGSASPTSTSSNCGAPRSSRRSLHFSPPTRSSGARSSRKYSRSAGARG